MLCIPLLNVWMMPPIGHEYFQSQLVLGEKKLNKIISHLKILIKFCEIFTRFLLINKGISTV